MRRSPAVLMAALLALSVLTTTASAAPADRAEPAESCGGAWQDENSCSLRYQGGGYSVSISLVGIPAGAGIVRLEMVDRKTHQRVVLLKCQAAGPFGGCAAGTTGPTTAIKPVRGQRLFCLVKGVADEGLFSCGSHE